ncbi:TolC family protein [Bacteriovoracales bacterium]|nr:TolC family protein [Bacteriovoracales bacterium]
MSKKLGLIIFLNGFFGVGLCQDKGKKVDLSLSRAIELGLQYSFEVKERRHGDQVEELRYNLKKRSFYLPKINVYAQNTISHTLLRAKSSDGTHPLKFPDEETDIRSNMAKEGAIGIEVSEFNFFNFGKDRDDLKRASLDLKRNGLGSKNFFMNYKFRITRAYFRLKEAIDKIELAKNELALNKAVYELANQKKKSGLKSDVDLLFSKSEMMNSQKNEKLSKRFYSKLLFEFNFLLGQPLQQDYKLVTEMTYRPLKATLQDLLKWIEVAPTLMEAKINLNQTKLSLRSTWKDLIPFPKVSLSGLRYGHAYGKKTGGTVQQFSGSSSSSNMDLRVGIDFSLPLVGENGLFNRFGVRSAELEVERAKNQVKMARMQAQGEIVGQYNDLKSQEEQIVGLKKSLKNSSLLLDKVFEAYKKGKIQGSQMRQAIGGSTQSNKELKGAILAHMEAKMALAMAIGMENPFEAKENKNEK